MNTKILVNLAVTGLGLVWLASLSPAGASGEDSQKTCASKYPNVPTSPPNGYVFASESDAYMAFRREARKAGYVSIEKMTRDDTDRGPCVEHGKHINMSGTKPASKGKKSSWDHIGSMTSCPICEETSRGPRLSKTLWRINVET
ncbi:hypothetical protein [Haliangium sp.]|uniref:hypothetical protein n=1 Tax=Haliangium sp. TaxID=2663208 RepID=UPI003D0A2AF7